MADHPHDEAVEPSEDRAARARERRRREILDAATLVFAERGYHNASINDIIDRAAIARGTFYLYFSSKHKIFESILDEALDQLRARIKPVIVGPDARAPRVQLRDQIADVLAFLIGDRALSALLLDHGLSPRDEVAERVAGFYRHVTEMIERSLHDGGTLGLIRRVDVGLIAAALLGAIRGVIGHVLADDNPPDLEAMADGLLDFALQGVVAVPRQ